MVSLLTHTVAYPLMSDGRFEATLHAILLGKNEKNLGEYNFAYHADGIGGGVGDKDEVGLGEFAGFSE